MSADWPSVLDEIEHRLVVAEQEITAGRFAFEPVEIPPFLGPLPPQCQARAQSLHAATVELERRVASAMEVVNAQLANRTSRVADRPAPSYIDRLA